MFQNLHPHLILSSFTELSPKMLTDKGIKGVIIDIDNTLVPHNFPRPTKAAADFIKGLCDAKLKVCLVSNNNKERVDSFNEGLGLIVFPRAKKPLKRTLKKALRAMGTLPGETAIVGDQIFSDIWGGRRLGLYTVLVRPIVPAGEGLFIAIKRRIEKRILGGSEK